MPQITATAGPGDGPALLDWPYLVWLPGLGVVTEDHHIPVATIGEHMRAGDDPLGVATRLGTTPEHVRQALNHLAATAPAP